MTTQSSQPRRGFFQRQNKEQNSAKAYLRNVGKGRLEFADNSLMFYIEKGTITRHKELALQVSLAGLERAALEANELSVTVQGETKRFVIEDATLAKVLFEKANEFSTQVETPEMQTSPENPQPISEEIKQLESAAISTEAQAIPKIEPLDFQAPVTGSITKPTPTEATPTEDMEKPSEEKTSEYENQQSLPAVESPSTPAVETQAVPASIEPELAPQSEPIVSTNLKIPPNSKASEIIPSLAVEKSISTSTPSETSQPSEVQHTSKASVEQLLLSSTTEFPFPAGATTEQALQTTQTESEPKLDVKDALSMVDALFDVFFSLQGSVDWQQINVNAKHYGKALRKIHDKKIKSSLDFSMLTQAVQERNIKLISKEGYRLLKLIYANFQSEAPENAVSKKVIESYFILNDVFLAKVVEDVDAENELSQFNSLITEIFGETESNVSTVIEAIKKAISVQEKDAYNKARSAFKQSLVNAATPIIPVL
jgi:hypothetical protein